VASQYSVAPPKYHGATDPHKFIGRRIACSTHWGWTLPARAYCWGCGPKAPQGFLSEASSRNTVSWHHLQEECLTEGCQMTKVALKASLVPRAPSMQEVGVWRWCGTRHVSANDRPWVEMFVNRNDCNNLVIMYSVWDPRQLGDVWTMFTSPLTVL
jgi:hypothetical protein